MHLPGPVFLGFPLKKKREREKCGGTVVCSLDRGNVKLPSTAVFRSNFIPPLPKVYTVGYIVFMDYTIYKWRWAGQALWLPSFCLLHYEITFHAELTTYQPPRPSRPSNGQATSLGRIKKKRPFLALLLFPSSSSLRLTAHSRRDCEPSDWVRLGTK